MDTFFPHDDANHRLTEAQIVHNELACKTSTCSLWSLKDNLRSLKVDKVYIKICSAIAAPRKEQLTTKDKTETVIWLKRPRQRHSSDWKGQERDTHLTGKDKTDTHLTGKDKAETLIWLERTRKRHSSDWKGQERDTHLTGKDKKETLIWLERTRQRHSSDWKGQGRDTHLTGKDKAETLIWLERTRKRHSSDWKWQDRDTHPTRNNMPVAFFWWERARWRHLSDLKWQDRDTHPTRKGQYKDPHVTKKDDTETLVWLERMGQDHCPQSDQPCNCF